MFCISLEPNHYNFIKELGYTPVGLGEKHFSSDWFSDKSGINISKKNLIGPALSIFAASISSPGIVMKNCLNKKVAVAEAISGTHNPV